MLVKSTELQFDVYHPQGMTRVGENWFMTSVETQQRPQPAQGQDARYDRTPGAGIGHLFKFSPEGDLLADITLGEGTMYHPGGIDFDGEYIWISVAEYRPDSHSIVYRVDPETLYYKEVMRFADHLGGILREPISGDLIGVSWGSRILFRWKETNGSYNPVKYDRKIKRDSDVDYQDCQLMNNELMACSGIRSQRIDNLNTRTVGGIELVDLNSLEVQHKIRVANFSATGELLTRNPFYISFGGSHANGLFFIPEDNRAALHQYVIE